MSPGRCLLSSACLLKVIPFALISILHFIIDAEHYDLGLLIEGVLYLVHVPLGKLCAEHHDKFIRNIMPSYYVTLFLSHQYHLNMFGNRDCNIVLGDCLSS